MRTPFEDSPEFRRLLSHSATGQPDLARIALEIASDAYPGLDIEAHLARVGALAERVRARCAAHARPRRVLGQVNWVFFVEEGFHGNTEDYYDPKNSYLNDVLDRKTGIPISLAVLYGQVVRLLGLDVAGVNLPAHFMLRVGPGPGQEGEPIFVDPFHGGDLLDRDGTERRISEKVGHPVRLNDNHLAPCSATAIVLRVLRNLKSIYLRRDDTLAAVPVQRRLAALKADDPHEQRDLAMLYLRTDRPADAIAPLESFLAASPAAPDAEDFRALLRAARREVARWN